MRGLIGTHSQRLERWYGAKVVEDMSRQMRGWYGPPIPLATAPGLVYATGDGDFVGPLRAGGFASARDYVAHRSQRVIRRWAARQRSTAAAGFSSLSDLLSEATTGGKLQDVNVNKSTSGRTASAPTSMWNLGDDPAAGGVGGASGTGRACTRATTGALGQANADSGDQLHVAQWELYANLEITPFLYDRLWDMTYNHATSTSTAIDSANRPSRYQTSALAVGNFISGEVTTVMAATSHTVTVTYVDSAGNTAEAAAAFTQNSATPVNRLWSTTTNGANWFVPLNAGHRGARYLTQVDQSTIASVTGINNFYVGHLIALFPLPVTDTLFRFDGINTAFNLSRIYDDACLAFLLPGGSNSDVTFRGTARFISG